MENPNIVKVPPSSVYIDSCPNCGKSISADRLYKGSVCNICLDKDIDFNNIKELVYELQKVGKLNKLKEIMSILEEYENFTSLFRRIIGSPPFGPQKSWIIRVLRRESFAIIAPPGLGKTTFGIITSIYFSQKKGKSILIFPTRSLVKQAVERISEFSKKSEIETKLLYYHSSMNESQKSELYKSLVEGDFNIFISTNKFFIGRSNKKEETTDKKYDFLNEIKNIKYDFLFVDDVDAALKSGKSSKAILTLAGFAEEDIKMVQDKLFRETKKEETKKDENGNKEEEENIFEEIQKIRSERLKNKTIIFSSATLTRGNPVLSALMGFKPGSSMIYIRKIIDAYTKLPDNDSKVVELLRSLLTRLGDGGLIFVPVDKGQEYAKWLAEELSNFNVAAITSTNASKIEEFAEGNLSALIGSATHYGILVRGLDLPWRVKYAIFVGIPKFKFKVGDIMNVVALSRILSVLGLVTKDKEVISIARRVKGKVRRMSREAINTITAQAREGKLNDETLLKGYEIANKYLKNEEILKKVAEIGDLVISGDSILIPDYLTYIQASGRTSRIFGGELTTGLSILLIDNDDLFRMLNKKLSLILDDITWKELDLESNKIGNEDLPNVVSKIRNEREKIYKVKKEGEIEPSLQRVKTVLLIVESPNKAKTISNFFSKPSIRQIENIRAFETVLEDKILIVAASGGHVYDLTTQNIGVYGVEVSKKDSHLDFTPYYNTLKRCKKGHQFTDYKEPGKCPVCGDNVTMDKTKTMEALRKLALEVDEILIGTDPDTEGEKIAWDIYLSLRPYNPNIKRAEFHEVTRKAILQAINNPRPFNINLVESQIVRRIEDRWIGFKLTEKVKDYISKATNIKFNRNFINNLSAGRVQTPVLNWIVKRSECYNSHKIRVYYGKLNDIKELTFYVIKQNSSAIRLNSVICVKINKIEEKNETINPLPPYTTDSLLYDANSFYGISAQETMRIAQDLFELGLITYHRTDSTRISSTGIAIAENYLKDSLGEEYVKVFKPRSWGEGGAHEGIRPTRPLDEDQLKLMIDEGELELAKELTFNHFRIYNLVFKRFITSQLIPLNVTKEKIEYEAYEAPRQTENKEGGSQCENIRSENKLLLLQNSSEFITRIDFPLKQADYSKFLYLPTVRIIEYSIKDKLEEGKIYPVTLSGSFVKSIIIEDSTIKSTVDLYTQAEIISEMKKKEIGRPSTYATILGTLIRRGYVMAVPKNSSRQKLISTPLGVEVNKYLNSNFSKFVSEERTRTLLQLMDMIEVGKVNYIDILNDVYKEISEIR